MGIRTPFVMLCACVLLLCPSPPPCSAQPAARAFSLEQVMSSPFPTNLVAAEHANENNGRIAWVFAARGERNVWAADAPNFEARQVTHYGGDDGMPIAPLNLTPHGRPAVSARASHANRAGETPDPPSNPEQTAQRA